MPSGVSQDAVACAGAVTAASLNSTPVKSGTRVIHLSLIDDGRLLVRDLQDTALLAQQAKLCWLSCMQAALALRDDLLRDTCAECGERTDRQIAWLQTEMKVAAPQALTTSSDPASVLRASLPLDPNRHSTERAAAVLGAAVLVFAVGAAFAGLTRMRL